MLTQSLSPLGKDHSLSVASDSSRSRKPLSRSSIASKCTQNNDLNQQIVALKQKAHQSFMQVIQIQQLHEEELDELRQQCTSKEQQHQKEVSSLRLTVAQLSQENIILKNNYRQHVCELSGIEFSLDNIEPIGCQEESKLDDSSISNYIEFINSSSNGQQSLRVVRQEMMVELSSIATDNPSQINKVQTMLDKLFEYIFHLKKEFVGFQQKQFQTKVGTQNSQEWGIVSRTKLDNMQRENKFLAQQISRLTEDKAKLQKQVVDDKKTINKIDQKSKGLLEDPAVRKKVQPREQAERKKRGSSEQKDLSMDLNDFIQHNINMMRSQKIKSKPNLFKSKN